MTRVYEDPEVMLSTKNENGESLVTMAQLEDITFIMPSSE